MAPTKFQIYVDESQRQEPDRHEAQALVEKQQQEQAKCPMVFDLAPNQKFAFDERKIYPEGGGDFSFEELLLIKWIKLQTQIQFQKRINELERENQQLKDKIELQEYDIDRLRNLLNQNTTQPLHQQQQHNQQQTTGRLSILPQSLQPTQGLELYGAQVDFPTVVHDWDTSIATRNTTAYAHDKFTAPINNSQYIKENLITSTPASKDGDSRRPHNFNRRLSRPSLGGGSPTLKLTPITETSREFNSKSSSSSSTTPATVKKVQTTVLETIVDRPDSPQPQEEDETPDEPNYYQQLMNEFLIEVDEMCDKVLIS